MFLPSGNQLMADEQEEASQQSVAPDVVDTDVEDNEDELEDPAIETPRGESADAVRDMPALAATQAASAESEPDAHPDGIAGAASSSTPFSPPRGLQRKGMGRPPAPGLATAAAQRKRHKSLADTASPAALAPDSEDAPHGSSDADTAPGGTDAPVAETQDDSEDPPEAAAQPKPKAFSARPGAPKARTRTAPRLRS